MSGRLTMIPLQVTVQNEQFEPTRFYLVSTMFAFSTTNCSLRCRLMITSQYFASLQGKQQSSYFTATSRVWTIYNKLLEHTGCGICVLGVSHDQWILEQFRAKSYVGNHQGRCANRNDKLVIRSHFPCQFFWLYKSTVYSKRPLLFQECHHQCNRDDSW